MHVDLEPPLIVGMLTCYDLRFPEGALALRRKGAEIIAYPSAFTMQTGTLISLLLSAVTKY